MDAYITFDFYSNTYGGSVPEGTFPRLAYKASVYLDKITFNRIKQVTDDETLEKVKYTVCEMVDQLYQSENSKVDGKTVKSVSNQGYSTTFVTEGDGGTELTYNTLYYIAEVYLPSWLLSFVIDENGGCNE